jgi:hypothetical protein
MACGPSPLHLIWDQLGRAVKISSILGLFSGTGSLIILVWLGSASVSLSLEGIARAIAFFALFGSYVLLQLASSLVILGYPLTPETRGILGFLVFITSIPGIAGILLLGLGLAGVRIWTS